MISPPPDRTEIDQTRAPAATDKSGHVWSIQYGRPRNADGSSRLIPKDENYSC